jgi:hypothetical protein
MPRYTTGRPAVTVGLKGAVHQLVMINSHKAWVAYCRPFWYAGILRELGLNFRFLLGQRNRLAVFYVVQPVRL